MKTKVLLLLTLFISTYTFAQKVKHKPTTKKVKKKTIKVEEDIVFTKVENDPGFVGGKTAWIKFLKDSLDADVPKNNGAPIGTYTVIVKIIIGKDGSVINTVVEKDPGYGTANEVIRLLKTSPKWKCVLQSGCRVNYVQRKEINFEVL